MKQALNGDLTVEIAALLAEHAMCGIVNPDSGAQIEFECGHFVDRPGPESRHGWVDLHRAHAAKALALQISTRLREAENTVLTCASNALTDAGQHDLCGDEWTSEQVEAWRNGRDNTISLIRLGLSLSPLGEGRG